MKRNFTLNFFLVVIALASFSPGLRAQCTNAELNWDHIDFLPSNNVRYTSFYPSAAFPYNQNFTIGPRKLNFVMAPQANITLNGENGANTAHAGSFATAGDDVQFTTTSTANTTVTMTFDADVSNVRFSLFDLDNSQAITVTATNGGGVAQTIAIAKVNFASAITIGGSGSTSATATGGGGNYASTDNNGTINITIAGPVRQIIVTYRVAAGDTWLSDIAACVPGTFPNNYQVVSRPFTGQPQYVITVVNNNVYYVDPTNGRGYFLFNEPGHDRLNSMAYDPYKRIVYYTYSLTDRYGLDPAVDKTLKKYDVDSKTISVVIPNVNTFGIPTYESGVESGAASFYNGSLYLGIEGYTGTTGTGSYAASRKSTIWKIDFDAAGNAIAPAAQVWGVTADDGVNAQNIHDWSDFGVSNGILTDFDGSASGGTDFYQFNMMTGVRVNYVPSGVIPRQVSIGWDEKLYNVDAAISLYNGTNGVGPLFNIFAPLGPTIPVGTSVASWGDAAGPYRPFLDFGDAPATYDPDPWSPACHDTLTPTVSGVRTRMRLGPNEDVEWLKRGFTTVEDNYEDGLAFVPIFTPMSGTYLARCTVFNNTGVNATVCAWLDFNGNGLFDAAEGVTPIVVPSSASNQIVNLVWPSAPSTLASGTFTYLRIRITNTSYNMTTAKATGYYDIGEVEDYRVIVDNSVLGLPLLSFDATLHDNRKVNLAWSATEEVGFMGYELQRNRDDNWQYVDYVASSQDGGQHEYLVSDHDARTGTTQYRLKLYESNGRVRYSSVRSIRINELPTTIRLFPNPARELTNVVISGDVIGQMASVTITSPQGDQVFYQKGMLNYGTNTIEIPRNPNWPPGVYLVHITTGKTTESRKLVLVR